MKVPFPIIAAFFIAVMLFWAAHVDAYAGLNLSRHRSSVSYAAPDDSCIEECMLIDRGLVIEYWSLPCMPYLNTTVESMGVAEYGTLRCLLRDKAGRTFTVHTEVSLSHTIPAATMSVPAYSTDQDIKVS